MNNVNTDIYNDLFQKINDLIDTLNNYISGLSNQSMSIVEFWTLIAALIAAIVSGISIYTTIRCDRKNRESEDKRAEAEIDANLKANARIEWIQNVRQAAAQLITACYNYTGSKPDEQKNNWEAAQAKKALFVLYFGPDDYNSTEIATSDLLDKNTNKGKNDLIVSFVNELYDNYLFKYFFNESNINIKTDELNKCYLCNDETQCLKDEFGTQFSVEDCAERRNEIVKSIEKSANFINDTFHNLRKLSEIMRIYIKIEWNRTKESKK